MPKRNTITAFTTMRMITGSTHCTHLVFPKHAQHMVTLHHERNDSCIDYPTSMNSKGLKTQRGSCIACMLLFCDSL